MELGFKMCIFKVDSHMDMLRFAKLTRKLIRCWVSTTNRTQKEPGGHRLPAPHLQVLEGLPCLLRTASLPP